MQDVEDQATAGLDIALTEHLRRLSNATKLEEAQVTGLRVEQVGCGQQDETLAAQPLRQQRWLKTEGKCSYSSSSSGSVL